MDPWKGDKVAPRQDMRVPLERTVDLERLDAVVWRAREARLSAITFVVPDRDAGPWLPAVLAAARRHHSARPPRILIGVEARIIDDEGGLSLETVPPRADRLYVTLDGLADGDTLRGPMELREAFEEGRLSATDIVARTVDVLRAAVRRYPGCVLSRPFALLAAAGIPEDWMAASSLEALARECAAAGVALQVDEWERTPRAEAVEVFARAGVDLLYGTGTRDAEGVGVYDYVRRLADRVPELAKALAARAEVSVSSRVAERPA